MAGLQPGQMIDEYRIISKIGKGGMATVYKAYQASVDRYVAIKVLSYLLVDSEEFLGRFKQEARLIARLEHPNILPVYDYGEDKGIPYLVMRFLDAGTLKDRMHQFAAERAPNIVPENGAVFEKIQASDRPRAPRMTLEEIDSIFSQLADALGYAHDNGVIHRDIKPSNVMLDRRGRIFLTDFGIAKLIEATGDGTNVFTSETVQLFTATGAITGTPDYMSPEQAQGLRLDQRSDMYSAAIVLYEMLTGRVPFDAETPMAVIMKQISEPLPQPSLIRPDLHPAIEAVVMKALEKSPTKRYDTMHDFLAAWKEADAEAEWAARQENQERSAEAGLIPLTKVESTADTDGKDHRYGTEHRYGKEPLIGKESLSGKEPLDGKEQLAAGSKTPTPEEKKPVVPAKEPVGIQEVEVKQVETPAVNNPAPVKNPLATTPPPAGSLHGLEDEPWQAPDKGKPPFQYTQNGEEGKIFLHIRNNGDSSIQALPRKHPSANMNRRILLIAGAVAMLILLIVGLAAGLNLMDFLHQVP